MAPASDNFPELKEVDKALRSFRRAEQRAGVRPGAGASTLFPRKWRRRLFLVAAGLVFLLVLIPPFRYPVEGVVSSHFFFRRNPETKVMLDVEFHRGIDLAAPVGTRVVATRSGRVEVKENHPSYGKVVVLRHLLGFTSYYAHLSETHVAEGDIVLWGQGIGAVGQTGRATGPHLHFEVRSGNRAIPPGPLLVFHDIRRLILRR